MDLKGKTAIITAGASGIGRVIAEQVHRTRRVRLPVRRGRRRLRGGGLRRPSSSRATSRVRRMSPRSTTRSWPSIRGSTISSTMPATARPGPWRPLPTRSGMNHGRQRDGHVLHGAQGGAALFKQAAAASSTSPRSPGASAAPRLDIEIRGSRPDRRARRGTRRTQCARQRHPARPSRWTSRRCCVTREQAEARGA